MIAILALLLASIFIRKALKKKGDLLDRNYISCADFAVFVRGIPINLTKEKLKDVIESKYAPVKVVYVNMCYKIDDFKKITDELTSLYRVKA
jgi:hypothetical protein